jgi:hypothetical protein
MAPIPATPTAVCCPPVPPPPLPTFSKAVLSYVVKATNVTPAQMKVAMEAVVLDAVDYPTVTLVTDVTVVTATGAQRTLTFALAPAFNTALLQGADPAAFFQNFFTLTLSEALVAPVVQLPPIVT